MSPEVLFQKVKGFSLAKTAETEHGNCRFAGLDPDVYRIDLDDVQTMVASTPVRRSSNKSYVPAMKRARCWACVGAHWNMDAVQEGLQQKYGVTIRLFSPGVL